MLNIQKYFAVNKHQHDKRHELFANCPHLK